MFSSPQSGELAAPHPLMLISGFGPVLQRGTEVAWERNAHGHPTSFSRSLEEENSRVLTHSTAKEMKQDIS